MVTLALVQLAVVVAGGWAAILVFKGRDSAHVSGQLRLSVLLTTATAAVAALLTLGSVVQETTGVAMGLPSNAKARARQWLAQHAAQPLSPREVGRNIRILADGLAFYEAHAASFPLDLRARMQEYARLPEQPKRLLTPSEENRYYQAAMGVVQAIRTVAGAESDQSEPRKPPQSQ
jgi:hypothetical protein